MHNVQFEYDNSAEGRKYAAARGAGNIPHISSDTKLYAGIFIAVMIGATLYIWLKFVSPSHPIVDDSAITPYSAANF